MHALIIVIFSIVLFALVLFAGITTMNTDYFNIKNKQYKVEADLANFTSSFSTYETLKRFKLPVSNWETEIQEISKYTFNTYNDGSVWEYNSNINGYYICLKNPEMNETLFRAIRIISKEREHGFVNKVCGANEDTTIFSDPPEFPAQAAFTYWITL